MIETYDLPHGTTFEREMEIDNADGADLNPTGSTLQFRVYDSPRRTTLVLSGNTHVDDAPTGKVTISIPASSTVTFTELRVLYGYVTMTTGATVWPLKEFKLRVL